MLRLERHSVPGGFARLDADVALALWRLDVANVQSEHLCVGVAVAPQGRRVGIEDGPVESHQQQSIAETIDGLL